MRTLLLLRHAKSSWKNPALDDHDRPLNKRGKRDAPRIGKLLAEQGLVPDLVLCSSARRARDTAFIALRVAGYDGETRIQRSLYMSDPESSAETLRRLEGSPGVVLVVGHNPGLEELVEALTGEVVELPTAGLARVDLNIERWTALELGKGLGRVTAVWRPKELSSDDSE
jgi:phosphohistidine phosphatase